MKKNLNIAEVRHSLAHLLAAAVLELWPDTKNTIGPAIDTGFYYDFEFTKPISEKDLATIEKKMREIAKKWDGFEAETVTESDAKTRFQNNPYKKELIDEIVERKEKITLYTSGTFVDLCRGGHVESIPDIAMDGWKLSRIAGAYWRGDEKNAMLTRIYGLAFASRQELVEYETQVEEAKKRDHKKLGPELDLFTFSELVGAGLPLWTPKGTMLRDLLDGFVWELRKEAGYDRVDIPHITKKDLYEKSGHWEKFKDELFRITTREGHEFAMKPMNCPHHTQIYARKQWSYRELPQRYATTTKVYRDEQSGELAGLSRVRSITQDDAHVFCRDSQLKEEMKKIWHIIMTFYGAFGFVLTPRLSLHDPKNMKAYLGSEASWLKTEDELRTLVKEHNMTAIEAEGEAAFYGPKVDFMAKDSLGRELQVATIQLDVNMPERFNLTCVNEKGEKERIVMIHAAIMGSIERFLAVLIEHFAGAFPLWLSPTQIRIVPINEKHHEFATSVHQSLAARGLRIETDLSTESLGKKIRAGKLEKIPYTLVIGDKEFDAKSVTVESRDKGNLGVMAVDVAVNMLHEETTKKTLR